MTIRRGRIAAFFCAALLFATTATAQTHVPCPVLNATSTAEYQLAGPYVGTWRYTIQIAWDVGRHDPSHVDVDQLCLSPQCGFSSTVEGNVLSYDEEVAKLRLIVETAAEVWG